MKGKIVTTISYKSTGECNSDCEMLFWDNIEQYYTCRYGCHGNNKRPNACIIVENKYFQLLFEKKKNDAS